MSQIKSVKQLFQEQFWRELQAAHQAAVKTQSAKVASDAKLFETMLKKEQTCRLQKKV
jgi:hypothetical protein